MTREVLLKGAIQDLPDQLVLWSSVGQNISDLTIAAQGDACSNPAIYMYIVNSKSWESEVNVYEMLMVDLFRNCLKWADCFFEFLKVKKKKKSHFLNWRDLLNILPSKNNYKDLDKHR